MRRRIGDLPEVEKKHWHSRVSAFRITMQADVY